MVPYHWHSSCTLALGNQKMLLLGGPQQDWGEYGELGEKGAQKAGTARWNEAHLYTYHSEIVLLATKFACILVSVCTCIAGHALYISVYICGRTCTVFSHFGSVRKHVHVFSFN